MKFLEIIINGNSIKIISLGKCACGCGGKTKIPGRNRKDLKIIKGQPLKFIKGHNQKGINNSYWRGGRVKDRKYIKIRNNNHYIREQTFLAERVLGKSLPKGSCVHHHNETQLVICESQTYHILLHQRQRAYESCGNVNWRKCVYCKQYDDPVNLILSKFPGKRINHKECHNKYEKERKSKNQLSLKNLSYEVDN